MTTIKEIAKLTNLSVGTVSLVLNGRGDQMRISKETQKRVLDAAKGSGYHPNVSARRLRQSGAKNVPVIATFWPSDLSASVLGRFFMAVQDPVLEHEYEFEMLIKPYKPQHIHKLKEMCDSGMFNAAIITGVSEENQRYLEDNDLSIPITLFNRSSNKYCSVYVDNYEIGRKTAELFASRGHRKVGMIVPESTMSSTDARKRGFIESCPRYGLELEERHISSGQLSMIGGQTAMRQMAGTGGSLPTALFFPISVMAVGALPVFPEKGIRIPEDMEIMTYGDHDFEQFSYPSLSAIHFPVEKMASACIRLMMDTISGAIHVPKSIVFDTPFIFRQTCPALPAGH